MLSHLTPHSVFHVNTAHSFVLMYFQAEVLQTLFPCLHDSDAQVDTISDAQFLKFIFVPLLRSQRSPIISYLLFKLIPSLLYILYIEIGSWACAGGRLPREQAQSGLRYAHPQGRTAPASRRNAFQRPKGAARSRRRMWDGSDEV